jgi:hypothetical protein
MPKFYPRLNEKFRKELRKGTKVVAYVWPFEDWKPKQISGIKGRQTLYLYEV